MYKFSNSSINVLNAVYGPLQALCYSVIANSPYDFLIPPTGGLRTLEEQKELFKKGYSKCDGIDKKSYHQSGFAIDIAILTNGVVDYKCVDKYEEISKIFIAQFSKMKSLGIFPENSYLRWGFDWDRDGIRGDKDPDEKFYDMPHFELRNIN